MFRRFAAVILSAILLSPGWLGMTGMTLLIGFVPLLWVSASYDDTRRSWWGMFGWATLAFVLWNALTIWWIWYATPVGPPAATLASTTMNMIAFMLFHTVSKKAPKALAYVTLVTAWITTEYWYTVGDFSWPWLILGNGFSHEVWAVQWYEYTGVFGGTLWVLLSNILIFEALQARRSTRRWAAAACSVALPMIASLCIWQSWEQPDEGTARVSVVQPNVDCYDKFHGDTQRQERNIADLMAEVPAGAQFILLPETAVPGDYLEPGLSDFYSAGEPGAFWQELTDSLRSRHPEALLITGAGTPTWVFDAMKFLVIDLGGTVGQIGKGLHGTAFEHNGVKTGPAICYEGLYGDFYGGFVRRGAQFMAIISNDGWWGDTPGYKHLFSISRLRAVEHRRAIAGRSGFISARGDVGQTLGWEQRGVITAEVPLNSELTFYTRYGDCLARISEYILLLSVLYYVAYRYKRRNHLVK